MEPPVEPHPVHGLHCMQVDQVQQPFLVVGEFLPQGLRIPGRFVIRIRMQTLEMRATQHYHVAVVAVLHKGVGALRI